MKNLLKGKKILIILAIILVVILVVSGTIALFKNNKEETSNEEVLIKESALTLDELYAIVEDPKLFYENNGATMTTYNIIMFHFYDYFSHSTPVKIATKVKRDEHNNVVEVLEVKYISYEEYLELMKDAYEDEALTKENYEYRNEKFNQNNEPIYDYRLWIDKLIYGSAETITEEE